MSKVNFEFIKTVEQQRAELERMYQDNLQFTLDFNAYLAEITGNTAEREKADREAILAEYRRLRALEYEWTVQNEAMKMYALAKDGEAWNNKDKITFLNNNNKKCTTTVGHSNHQLPQAYAPYANSSPERREQVENSAARFGKKLGGGGTFHTCALASSCLIAQISDKMNTGVPEEMGEENRRNLITLTNGDNANSTVNCYKIKSIPEDCRIDDNDKNNERTVNELIAAGIVGPGDQLIVPSNNGSSGRHAVTVASVEKDETGKIIGYTLQGNNSARLVSGQITYDDKGKPHGGDKGTKKVLGAVLTHKWMDKKIDNEIAYLQNMSLEDLQAQLNITRERVVGTYNAETKEFSSGLMADLAQTEYNNEKRGYNSQIGGAYKQENMLLAAEINSVNTDNLDLNWQNLGAMTEIYGRQNPTIPLATYSSEEVESMLPRTVSEDLASYAQSKQNSPKQKKKNIFQKAGDWFKGAAEDTASWCKGAYATVTGKGKKEPEAEPAKPTPPVSTEMVKILLGDVPSISRDTNMMQTTENTAPDLVATTAAQTQTTETQTLATKGAHDFWFGVNDFLELDPKDSMRTGADTMSNMFLADIMNEFVSPGTVSEAMRNDNADFLEIFGLINENNNSELANLGHSEQNDNTQTASSKTSFKGPDLSQIMIRGGGWSGRA